VSASAIIWQSEDDELWYAQEQGVCGRQTIGGYATRKACIAACAETFGEDVCLEVKS